MLAADGMRLLPLCAAFGAGTAAALAPQDAGWAPALWANGSLLAAAGGVGILGATTLIHIYITPIKRALQVLAALGCAGGAWLALQHSDVPLPQVRAGWDGVLRQSGYDGLGAAGTAGATICPRSSDDYFVRHTLPPPAPPCAPQYVADHPGSMWFVGPAFAALAGICFKEGVSATNRSGR